MQILYEDENYIGFFKPAKTPTTYGKQKDCFIEKVKNENPELFSFTGFNECEGGLLYRLDNEACGLLLFAKNETAFRKFEEDTELEKIYIAKVANNPPQKEGFIPYPIVHKSSKKMSCLTPDKKITYKGNPIRTKTKYETVSDKLIKCRIKKGARHQIRVHLAAIGSPIIGDKIYGEKEQHEKTLHLCCIGISSGNLNIDTTDKIKKNTDCIS